MQLSQSLRGRPIRFPRDTTPMADIYTDSTPRLAWLLLRWRLHSGVPRLVQRKSFADGLVSLGVNADPSRVSRWESGSHRIPERVLFGYAEMLGLPAGHFTAIAHNLRSAIDPTTEPGSLLITGIPETQPELDALFSRMETHPVSGDAWIQLAAAIDAGTYMYLPEAMWADLVEKLLGELVRSVGIAHIQRLAASGVVARHLPAQRVMAKGIGRLVTTPATRFVSPALMLFRDIVNPEVDSLLLRMASGPRGQVRRGASTTIASKVARGHFDENVLAELEAAMPDLLENRVGLHHPTDTVNILAALDAPRQQRILQQLEDRAGVPSLEETLRTGLSVPVDRSHKLASMIARRATGMVAVAGALTEADQMLVRLLEEALFHVHRERRYQAALLLGASPFAEALPTAIMGSLETSDRYSTSRGLSLISFLDPKPEIAGQLLQWVLNSPQNWLKCRAMVALTPLGPHLGDAAQDSIASMIAASDDAEVLHTGLNLLGVISAPKLEMAVEGKPDGRAAAEWWREFGPVINETVQPRPQQADPA
ncbi:MAG: hypothetical protein JWQ74_1239 [Marmoricola sp.]|nr:hypothetical protein [Marmoricola sp.]